MTRPLRYGAALLCMVCVFLCCTEVARAARYQRVLLSDVQVITLVRGRKTAGRRVSAISQLTCSGGTANCAYTPESVLCRNMGSDGVDVQWKCEADMDGSYKLGQVEVQCEGYEYREDPYILAGSCGLTYSVDFTDEGRYSQGSQNQYSRYSQSGYKHSSGTSWGSSLFFILGLFACLYYCVTRCNRSGQGAGVNGDDNAPGDGIAPRARMGEPGPAPRRQNYFQNRAQGSSSMWGSNRNNRGNNSGMGFWSGIAAGGALGYLFGNRGNRRGNYGYGNAFGNRGGPAFRAPSAFRRSAPVRRSAAFGRTTRR